MGEPEINFDSQWNMASAYFFRCHVELTWSNFFSAKGDFRNQYTHLFNLHRELSGQMRPEELKEVERLEESCRIMLSQSQVDVLSLRKSLYTYEIYMRQIMKLRKMDLPRSKDPGKAIIGGGNDGNY